MRTVPVGRAVPSDKVVGHYDDIRSYVAGIRGPFAVMNCVCRQSNDLKGSSCDHGDIRETCLMIGENAIGMVGRGNAREVGKEEFLGMLDRAEEKGFVIQPRNTQDPTYICCCCGDCCEILLNAKKFPKPVEVMHSNFFAVVDSQTCTGCSRCEKRCPMDAVSVENRKAVVNLDRCIGCGVCVPTCKPESIKLQAKKTSYVPPRNATLMFLNMYRERFGLLGVAKVIGKVLLRMQV
jgi:Pyruvate/2-oxoacid:ferredoxin oxidoreductase delta subunit